MTEKETKINKRSEGRPTVFTPEVLQKLEEAFALGCTDKEACVYADIAPSSLYNYQNENSSFLERKEALKETPILKARASVVRALENDYEHALKFLERKLKGEFSLRQEVTGKDGDPIQIQPITGMKIINDKNELRTSKKA